MNAQYSAANGSVSLLLPFVYKCGSKIYRWCIQFPLQILLSGLNLVILPIMLSVCGCGKQRQYDTSEEVVVQQPSSIKCKHCETLQIEIENLKRKKLEDDELSNKTFIETVGKLQRELDTKHDIQQKYNVLKERSDKITAEMASVLEERSELENVNDEFSNTKLAKRFENLYNNSWTSLSEWIDDNKPDLDELSRISILTKMMECGYKRCLKMADTELRVFLYIDDNGLLPSKEKDPVLYKVRKKYGQTISKRKGIAKILLEELLKKEEFSLMLPEEDSLKAEGLDLIQKFLLDYLECCWLMTISSPQLILDFNVKGYKYGAYLKDRFKLFSCQDEVVDKTQPKDCIFEVVWPSVELIDGSGIHTKGDVITVDVGKEAASLDSDSRSSCDDEVKEVIPLLGKSTVDTTSLEEMDNDDNIHGDKMTSKREVTVDSEFSDGQRETNALEESNCKEDNLPDNQCTHF